MGYSTSQPTVSIFWAWESCSSAPTRSSYNPAFSTVGAICLASRSRMACYFGPKTPTCLLRKLMDPIILPLEIKGTLIVVCLPLLACSRSEGYRSSTTAPSLCKGWRVSATVWFSVPWMELTVPTVRPSRVGPMRFSGLQCQPPGL